MTQADFDKLPGLLTAAQFRAATGVPEAKLRDWRTGKVIRSLPWGSKFRYYKADAARMGGFKFN